MLLAWKTLTLVRLAFLVVLGFLLFRCIRVGACKAAAETRVGDWLAPGEPPVEKTASAGASRGGAVGACRFFRQPHVLFSKSVQAE